MRFGVVVSQQCRLSYRTCQKFLQPFFPALNVRGIFHPRGSGYIGENLD
ncbi:hypothetical protein [Methylomonas albis]|nr:hypothetical protein [Methylomonas albis]